MATRLFVGNLSENTNEADLRTAFSIYGEITNLDLKSKSGAAVANDSKKFAFVTLSATNYDVESCIKHFTNEDFQGNKVYVTRARESFLERLQREREQARKKEEDKPEHPEPKKNPVIKLGDKLNPRKRKIDNHTNNINHKAVEVDKLFENKKQTTLDFGEEVGNKTSSHVSDTDKKKLEADKKRMESMKKKRQEFKEKQMIIKTGLTAIDKVPNKKTIFSDNEEDSHQAVFNGKATHHKHQKNNLFDNDDGESGDELNFEIKKQFEGKKGQKVLDLQSRYKSDKRFVLDERFVEDQSEDEKDKETGTNDDKVELKQTDEKDKQLNILQDVLGVSIRRNNPEEDSKKNKPKLGMLRFDPAQPEHAKFLAPIEDPKQKPSRKSKKKSKENQIDNREENPMPEVAKPEVSKEQFYKVSETLKEAIAQPNTFSLRSLFTNNEATEDEDNKEQDTNFIPLVTPKEPKVKNPLNPSERNPFVYDSSDSETEDVKIEQKPEILPAATESKAIWKENLFFTNIDNRLTEGLAFFNNFNETGSHKERRELKSLVKKRIYNKERKNQMFQKKIGGRKKSLKKSYRKKT